MKGGKKYVKNFTSLSYLLKFDTRFITFLPEDKKNLILEKRKSKTPLTSEEIIETSFLLEDFLLQFFKCDLKKYRSEFSSAQKINFVKRNFIQRSVALKFKDFTNIPKEAIYKFISEEDFAGRVIQNENNKKLINYARFALFTKEGKEKHKSGTLFKLARKTEIPFTSESGGEIIYKGDSPSFHKSREEAMWETKYCIYCHPQDKDYCRKGNPVAKKDGCPLDQKISEMNYLKSEGGIIAPLACLMIDNPLCILTGERICNDCKKACIFQKQEGVDVPAIETLILKDVLMLAFGFEIYSLLTRWNPLLTEGFLPSRKSRKKVLVCGSGPAGIAASFYALKEGFDVTLIDGLQIFPVPLNFLTLPVEDVNSILQRPDPERLKGGFGGVMEYGITDRWNKNFLLLAQILLERWKGFKIYGGMRFGSNITVSSAIKAGFSHIFLCTGAGRPKFLEIEGKETEGVITASNFLMSVHLGGKRKEKLLKEPVVILGAGLTAIDAAMEASKTAKTSLFYRNEMKNSRAFALNDMEVEEAMNKNIQFFENKTPSRIISKDGYVSEVLFADGTRTAAKTVILALGTEKQEWANSAFVTKLGDLDEKYAGSVVKAIASVKSVYKSTLVKVKQVKTRKTSFFYYVRKVEEEFGLLKLMINGSFKIEAAPLNVFKLQIFRSPLVSLPVTLFEIQNKSLTFYIKKHLLPEIKVGERVILMKAKDNLEKMPDFLQFVVEDEAFFLVFSKVFQGKTILFKDYNAGSECEKPTLFYTKNYAKVPKSKNNFIFLLNQMQCMLGGVCSKCVIYKEDGSYYFSCAGNIICSA